MKNKSVDIPNWGKCQYSGKVNSGDQPHGYGTAVESDGWRYEGTYQDGSLVTGKQFRPDGFLRYEGEFKGGLSHGTGKQFRPDGFLEYEGEWKGGRIHGTGTAFHRNGSVLTGRYEKDELIDGTRTCPDGRVEKYVNGKAV